MNEAQLDALLSFAERAVVNPTDLEYNVRGTKMDAGGTFDVHLAVGADCARHARARARARVRAPAPQPDSQQNRL